MHHHLEPVNSKIKVCGKAKLNEIVYNLLQVTTCRVM
jgi:hypothetical protein